MIKITEDTVFNTEADWIVNTVNCVGVMGKGLALEFALRFPKLKEIYINQCKQRFIKIGKIYSYTIDGLNIINFPTKIDFKYPSQYDWIERGLKDFVENYKSLGIKSIAFPLLGCTNGELDKAIVMEMMNKWLAIPDVTVYICKSIKLAGKEKEMVESFKKCSIEQLSTIVKLNKNQRESIESNKEKIDRFYKILDLDKIGHATYEKLFLYFYKNSTISTVQKTQEIEYPQTLFELLDEENKKL